MRSRRALAGGLAVALAFAATATATALLLLGGRHAGNGAREGGAPGPRARDAGVGPDRAVGGAAAGPAARAGDGGARDEMPEDLRQAIAGGPRPIRPAADLGGAGRPGDERSSDPPAGPGARDGSGPGAGHGPAGGEDPAGGAAGPDPLELARRVEWVKRQERRNDLRVEVLRAELGLGEATAERIRRAFTDFVTAKVALYEALEAENGGKAALVAGLDGIRADLERRLKAEIGRNGYDAYVVMDKAGRFALPEEKKRP